MIHGHTITLYSTGKCNGVTMYHLSVGICAMDIQFFSSKYHLFSCRNKKKIRLEKKKIY